MGCCNRLDEQDNHLRTCHGIFSRAERPSEEITRHLILMNMKGLKGQCHEIFASGFLWISFPPAPEYSIRTVSNFFENSWRYSQVNVHHRYQQHRWQICHRSTTPVTNLPPVSTIPVCNLPAVSTTPVLMTSVANNGNNIRLLRP